MKNVIVYPVPLDNWNPEFSLSVLRFYESFKEFPPGCDYELWAVACWGEPVDALRQGFYGIKTKWYSYYGACDCISVHQWAASQVEEAFLICMTTRCYFHRAGWLERFVSAREKHGVGLYGVSASFEQSPHICNRAYALDAALFRDYPMEINGRKDAPSFETGPKSITCFVNALQMPCLQVRWDGIDQPQDWRKPENIFRRGNQEQCLVFDRHTDLYRDASEEEKIKLAKLADGA